MYAFKGISAAGKAASGVKDADSPKALRQLLRKEGIVVTDVTLSKSGAGGKAAAAAAGKSSGLSRQVDLGALFGGVKKGEVAAFTRQLATLLKSGIPLAEALGALFEQIENVRFKVPIGEVKTAVNEGSSLADALSKHKKIFDDLYISMVRAGEVAGNLDEVLSRLADFIESSQKLKGKVQGAMVYPIIMAVIGIVIMSILMIAVIPELTKMFKQRGKTLPVNTRFLIWTSNTLGHYFLFILVGLIGAGYGFYRWTKSATGRPTWHRFVLRVPVVGALARQVNIARFARTLSTMLHAGVPMLRSLETGKEIMGNVILKKAIEDAKIAVTEGEALATTLKRSGHFPPTVIHMIAVGERAGQLEQMLGRVADTYEADVDTKLQRFTTLLEPLMLVVMGGTVAFVVFSILQPIMDMGTFGGH
ncbi:MAG TPA: type II secretion system inner membrane protein GspF [Kofleriaceae bacterium]|nr:type II secretion system inner membrane protein GspF [Kofleriaceae bacterium]